MWWLAAAVALAADEEIVVVADEEEATPNEVDLDEDAVRAFPARSPADLLRAHPGVHLSAHGGHGKAPQIFVRGFDAVHGSDLAVSVEGIPLNEPSNVHGHGYLDLWLLPEDLVTGVTLLGGAAHPDRGDFAVAAAADYRLGLARPGAFARMGVGTDRSGALTLGWRPERSRPGTFALVDVDGGLGVGTRRSWRQAHVAAGLEVGAGDWSGRLLALLHDGAFQSPGVLREDDVASGEIGFYDAYDTVGGGASSRALFAAKARHAGDWDVIDLTLWGQARRLTLEQDYTGFYDFPEHGDATRQEHAARSVGARVVWRRALETVGGSSSAEIGAETRLDTFEQGDTAVTPDGVPWAERYDARGLHAHAGGWMTGRFRLGDLLDVQPGIRVDALRVRTRRTVEDGVDVAPDPIAVTGALVSPSAAAVVHPLDRLSLRAAYGNGFRSPEARGLTESGRAPVTRVRTGELGARVDLAPVLVDVATYVTGVTDELVFDHTAARYLATGSTRRLGAELDLGVRVARDLRTELTVALTDGRYAATGRPIPYTPRQLVALGLFAEERRVGEVHVTGGLRAWVLGPRPLPDGFTARPAVSADLTVAVDTGPYTVRLDVDNPFGVRWRDGVFVYPSRFDTSRPRSDLPAYHFTAGAPPAARVSVEARF